MTDIQYKVVRSDRKSMVLVIDSEAKLIVRAPYLTKESEIADFIKKKKRWILEKQEQISAFNKKQNPVIIKKGANIQYLGNTYAIQFGSAAKIQISGTNIILPRGFTKKRMTAWFKREARKLIDERVDRYAKIMGARYASIRLSGARTRWGSCSGKNKLNFTWRLIMCPIAAIDYVIVHELSHITYKNHSPGFWALVKTAFPDFKEQKKWLKTNRYVMDII
jgi:predicted metal-dependent hydrolase